MSSIDGARTLGEPPGCSISFTLYAGTCSEAATGASLHPRSTQFPMAAMLHLFCSFHRDGCRAKPSSVGSRAPYPPPRRQVRPDFAASRALIVLVPTTVLRMYFDTSVTTVLLKRQAWLWSNTNRQNPQLICDSFAAIQGTETDEHGRI